MTPTRRRFLSISAAALGAPGLAVGAQAGAGFGVKVGAAVAVTEWTGIALGADCRITLRAPPAQAEPALAAALAALSRVEAQFTLHDPSSALSRLNRHGTLHVPDPDFVALMSLSARVHHLTGGLFDPTIQPLWQALARGGETRAARATIGWERLHWDASRITLAPGQALSFNGIAQGFATDRVVETLAAHGLGDLLVDIGEIRGIGGPWRLGLSDPDHGPVGTRTLRNGAIATSSPRALALSGGAAHILDPRGGHPPRWSTVSVEADTAALADALSTAMCLMPAKTLRVLSQRLPEVRRITVVGFDGDLMTI